MRRKKKPGRRRSGGRRSTVVLVVECIRVLCGVRLRVEELAEVLGVSESAARRLLAGLREAGVPLRSQRTGREVRWWLDRGEASAAVTAFQMSKMDGGSRHE